MIREISHGIPCEEISAGRITVPVIFITTMTPPAVCGHMVTPKIQHCLLDTHNIYDAAIATEPYENMDPEEITIWPDIIESPSATNQNNPEKQYMRMNWFTKLLRRIIECLNSPDLRMKPINL